MLILQPFEILNAVLLGVFAAVACGPLMREGMALHLWFRLVDRIQMQGFPNFAKPFGYCALCFSGQSCFWYFIFAHKFYGLVDFIALGCFACVGMLTVYLLDVVGVCR